MTQISSIGWLNNADGTIKLTPCLNGNGHATPLTVSQTEFDNLGGDTEAMKILASIKLGLIKTHEANKLFLDSVEDLAKNKILSSIADHHGVSVDIIYSEVTTEGSYHLLEYMVEPNRSNVAAHMLQRGFGFS